uniref:Uncharacterized protein n=1 Tax=Escherichia coli TaxID=562 RepID=A0A1U9XF04_ECOLX|nr:hypothetical protein 17-2_00128 [Escherichia coli]
MKIPLIIASALLISACSHTPNPVQKKGDGLS